MAGIAEPRLLGDPDTVRRAILFVERVTWTLRRELDRADPEVRVLRQTLGYCWSVVVAADPLRGLAALTRLETIDDPDMHWIARENREKKRMPASAAAQ